MFAEFVKTFKAGHLDSQLTKELKGLTESVMRHCKKGKLIIDISLEPKAEGEIRTIIKFKAQPPKHDTLESIMFATPENNLIDSNPKQPELFDSPVKEAAAKPSIIKAI